MGKLIIDSDMAKMPRNCHECYMCYGGWCAVIMSDQDEMCPDENRPMWCPLSEYNEPSKIEIKHAISNVDIPKGVDEEQFFAVLSQQYAALAKLCGEDVPTYSPS